MNKNTILLLIGIIGVIIIGAIFLLYKPEIPNQNQNQQPISVNSFQECKNAGYQTLDAYPIQCKTPEGKIFVQAVTAENIPQDIKDQIEAKKDLIVVDVPTPFSTISSPLKVTGKARGTWFFEASFPIMVVDWDGKIIFQTHANATSDWMTQDFVPFEATIEFPNQNTAGDFLKGGAIIFHNDNPSGLPQNDKALEIPILFGQ